MNALALIKLTKGKGIILSSEANSALFQRSPIDCQAMAQMFGITNTQDQIATVRGNCALAFRKAHLRKTFKGVAELVAVESSSQKMETD